MFRRLGTQIRACEFLLFVTIQILHYDFKRLSSSSTVHALIIDHYRHSRKRGQILN